MRLFANVRANLARFAKKAYRDGFLETTVRGGIALQIRALRLKFGDSQEGFARRTGKKQSVISRLEDPEQGKASVQTLIEIAQAADVALVVRFVSYPEFLAQTEDMSPEGLQVQTVFESLEHSAVPLDAGLANVGLYSRLGRQSGLAAAPRQDWFSVDPDTATGLNQGGAQYFARQH